MQPDSDLDDENEEDAIYTSLRKPFRRSNNASSSSLSKRHDKLICTNPAVDGAGETETEVDEPPRHLPTSRNVPFSGPLIPPNILQQRLTPLLFEFSRLASVIPALIGFIYNIHKVLHPPSVDQNADRHPPERIDYLVSALWALLTVHQSLSLATGLYARWRLYYTPLPTLIRLVALQAICWPALHFTLRVFDVSKRPVITWAIVGTTTTFSRSVQIWVTSNLWWEVRPVPDGEANGSAWQRWRGGKWGGRRWDWKEVGLKCLLPAGVLYFVMAWAELIRREMSGC